MTTRFFTTLLLSASASAFISGPAFAAVGEKQQNTALPVTVNAYRFEYPLDKTGSSVTVLTRDEMQRRGYKQVTEALKSVPGVSVTRNGGTGALSFIRLRGSNPGQVKVLIDGVAVNDPTNTESAFDFGSLTIDTIERIEVLRGPQSALYGSDAMGGVIAITTRGSEGRGRSWEGFAETGSYGTYQGGITHRGAVAGVKYGVSGTQYKTAGFSRARSGQEIDGSRISDLSGDIAIPVTEQFSVDARGHYNRSVADFDPSATTDGPAFSTSDSLQGQTNARLSLFDRAWQQRVTLAAHSVARGTDEPVGFFRHSTFDGTRKQATYQSDVHLRARDVATAGLEWQREEAENRSITGAGVRSTDLDRTNTMRSVFGQYLLGLGDNATLTLGGRHDDHQRFGAYDTWRATGAYTLPWTDTLLRASYGTGFKAPTLFQLYSRFGSATLRPEESRGFDAGFEQPLWNRRITFGSGVFHTEYENLIDFDNATSRYNNIAKAVTKGVESTVTLRAAPDLLFSGNHTYLHAENGTNDRWLPRRPRHSASLAADYDISDAARIGAEWKYTGPSRDSNFNNTITKSYATVDVTGSYDFAPNFGLYGRLENLFDRDYQEVANYQTPGFSAYVGLRARY